MLQLGRKLAAAADVNPSGREVHGFVVYAGSEGQRRAKVPFAHAQALAGTTAGPRSLFALECGHEDAVEVEGELMVKAL